VTPEVEEWSEGPVPELVLENARRKVAAVPGPLVLGVDTTVVLEGRCFGKPRDAPEAAATLRALSGRAHEVWSAIALRRGGVVEERAARTVVCLRSVAEAELAWYLASGEWRERAGGYAIQGRGAAFVERIEGDFWTVVGLPVTELVDLAPELVFSL
jgi:septum formation protein